MSYMALYRKWRPDTFAEVKGQDHIVTTLKNQLIHNRIGHAYLFTGTRGTGKTTVAKLFAKAVNCEHPMEDGSPCLECANCRAIKDGSSMNVIEIDAASNNGVDNIREIREEVQYSPTDAKYKVYIIDEVHMLSSGAFNALLKTLEEPPAYVIFILATTEVHKIPITILSRCQRYDFHRIPLSTIADRLAELMEREGQTVEREALEYVAKVADGSMRDALSLLDRCISFYLGENLTYDKCLEILGAVDTEVFLKLLHAVNNKQVDTCVEIIDGVVWEGSELTQFVTDFTWFLRNMLMIKSSNESEKHLDYSKEVLEGMKAEAEQTTIASLLRYVRIFAELPASLRYASNKRVLLEVAIIKLCVPEMEIETDALLQRMDDLAKQVEQSSAKALAQRLDAMEQQLTDCMSRPATISVAQEDVQTKNRISEEERFSKQVENLPQATYEELQSMADHMEQAYNKILPGYRNFLYKAKVFADGNTMSIVILADKHNQGLLTGTSEVVDALRNALREVSGRDIQVEVRCVKEEEEPTEELYNLDFFRQNNIEIELTEEE